MSELPNVPDWLLAGSARPEAKKTGLPRGFTAIHLSKVLTAKEAHEDLVVRMKPGKTLRVVLLKHAMKYNISGDGVHDGDERYKRIVAIPNSTPVLLLCFVDPATQKHTQNLVLILESQRPDVIYDEYLMTITPEQHKECSGDAASHSKLRPQVLYSRVSLKDELFHKTDTAGKLRVLFVKVDEFILGVPPEMEFMKVAYSPKSILVAVKPGPELMQRLEKPDDWALVFEVNDDMWQQKAYFNTQPWKSNWTIGLCEIFVEQGLQYLNSVDYRPEGDLFGPRTHAQLVDERLAVAAIQSHKMLAQWRKFSRFVLIQDFLWSDTRQLLEFYKDTVKPIAHKRASKSHKMLAQWREFSRFVLPLKVLEFYKDTVKPIAHKLETMWSILSRQKNPAWFRKFKRLFRNVLKLERDKNRTQLLPKIYELCKRRLAMAKLELTQIQASLQALTMQCGSHAMQLANVQQQHAMQLANVQQQHAMELANVQQQHAMELANVQQQHAMESAAQLAKVEAERQGPEQPMCIICTDELPDIIFQPCQHQVVCSSCFGPAIPDCPNCRVRITAHVNAMQVPAILCNTCRFRLPNIVLLPCGHQVLCDTCAAAKGIPEQCPVCGANVGGHMKTFL